MEALKGLANLFQLDIADTDVSKLNDYRNTVFEMFPNLKILDNKDREEQSVMYSDNDEEYEQQEGGSEDEDDKIVDGQEAGFDANEAELEQEAETELGGPVKKLKR